VHEEFAQIAEHRSKGVSGNDRKWPVGSVHADGSEGREFFRTGHLSKFGRYAFRAGLRRLAAEDSIGVFDPVYDKLPLDEMLERVSALGLEAMEIGTGGYPGTGHCPIDELLGDAAKAKAWKRNSKIAAFTLHAELPWESCSSRRKARGARP